VEVNGRLCFRVDLNLGIGSEGEKTEKILLGRVWGGEMHTEFWWRNLREGDHFEDTCLEWEDMIKMDLREVEWGGMDCIDLAVDRER
jgi:hypothetical protein